MSKRRWSSCRTRSLSDRDRANYQAQYNSQVKDIGAFVKDAKYNGVNLLQQGAQNQNIASNGSGGSVTVQAQDLESSVANVLSGADVSTAAGAAALLQPGGDVLPGGRQRRDRR